MRTHSIMCSHESTRRHDYLHKPAEIILHNGLADVTKVRAIIFGHGDTARQCAQCRRSRLCVIMVHAGKASAHNKMGIQASRGLGGLCSATVSTGELQLQV